MFVVPCTCAKMFSVLCISSFFVKYLVTMPVHLLSYFKLSPLGIEAYPFQHGQFFSYPTPPLRTALHWEDQRIGPHAHRTYEKTSVNDKIAGSKTFCIHIYTRLCTFTFTSFFPPKHSVPSAIFSLTNAHNALQNILIFSFWVTFSLRAEGLLYLAGSYLSFLAAFNMDPISNKIDEAVLLILWKRVRRWRELDEKSSILC